MLQNHLYRVLTSFNTKRWIDFLQPVVDSYNERKSSALFNHSPNWSHRKENEEYLRGKYMEKREMFKKKFVNEKPAFDLSQKVRIIKSRGTFERGYTPNFESEIRTIEKVLRTYPITYKISGKQKPFYKQQIVAVEEEEEEEEEDNESLKERGFYIADTRTVNKSISTSGQERGEVEKEYLLRDHNNPTISKWINQRDYSKLKNESILH